MTRAEHIRFVAHGAGILGTNRKYLANIVSLFATLGIRDEECLALLSAIDEFLTSTDTTPMGANEVHK